jgi:nucleoside-diphosphate-sugar epimerase
VKDNKKDLLDPAINGTLQVLSSVAAYNPSVKRVVITSSFAAIWNGNKGNWPEHNYTESDWNPMTYEEASKKDTDGALAYCASKTLAERAAFDFVKEKKLNFQVTTICPPMVYGPLSHEVSDLKSLNTSSAEIYNLMNGSKTTVPDTSFFAFVDVRDVGEAHALAYENEEAAGQRYLVTGGSFTFQNICDIIRKDFPELRRKIPEGTPGAPLPAVYRVDNEKARKELGIKFRNLETTIHDQVLVFLELEKKFGTTSA